MGQVKFYPYKKGGPKNLSHAEGGGGKCFGVPGSFNVVA